MSKPYFRPAVVTRADIEQRNINDIAAVPHPAIIKLARLLQRASFHDDEERSKALSKKPNFEPAPVYVNQAYAMWHEPDVLGEKVVSTISVIRAVRMSDG